MKQPLIIILLLLSCLFQSVAQSFYYERTIALSGKPKGICAKESHYLYVSLSSSHRVVKINKHGVESLSIGAGKGVANNQLNAPNDVDIDQQSTIYVADRGNKRVQVFNSNGVYIRTEYRSNNNINGVTIGPDNRLYIACDNRVIIYENGMAVDSILSLSTDQFRIVNKVYFDRDGAMFIVDANTGVVKTSGHIDRTAQVDFIIKKREGANYYNRLGYMTTCHNGNIIASVSEDRAAETGCGLFRFNPMGGFIDTISPMGASDDEDRFNLPYGLAMDDKDSLYVANYGNSTIRIWKEKDLEAPTVTLCKVKQANRQSVDLQIQISKPATLHYLIRENSQPAPTLEQIQRTTEPPITIPSTQATLIQIPAPKGDDLIIYYLLADSNNNLSIINQSPAFSTNIPMAITSICVTDKQPGQIKITLKANDSGIIHYLIKPDSPDNTPPTQKELLENGNSASYPIGAQFQTIEIAFDYLQRMAIYVVANHDSQYSPIIEHVVSPYDDIYRIRDRYHSLLTGGDLPINYTNPQIQLRYQSLQSSINKAKQKAVLYDPNKPLPAFDLGGASQTPDIVLVKDLVANTLLPLALSYHIKGDEQTPNADYHNPNILDEILKLYSYLANRNFLSGSVLPFEGGGVYLGLTGYYYASLLMRNELEQAGMLTQVTDMMKWGTRWVNSNDDTWGPHVVNNTGKSDGIRTLYNNFLLTQLTLSDQDMTSEQGMYMLTQALNNNLRLGSAWNGFLKPDYTGYHHLGIWGNGYITDALHVASQIAYILSGSSYALESESINNIANGLLAYRDYSCKYDVSRGLCGRFPNQLSGLYQHIPALGYLCEITSGELHEKLHEALHQLYDPTYPKVVINTIQQVGCNIIFSGGLGTQYMLDQWALNSTTISQNININRTFPYGAMQIHRRSDWMATVKGYNKYVWDFETNGSENWYGRNQSAGQLSIYSGKDSYDVVTAQASGVGYDGWDWSHTPGATHLNMPFEDMLWEAQKFQWSKFSPESFASGVSNGTSGVYGMKYADIRQAYDYNNNRKWLGVQLTARKSYFFFDDIIVALATDINNLHSSYEAHTTLFQNLLPTPTTPTYVNGIEHVGLNQYDTYDNDKPIYLLDIASNGYYLPSARGLSINRAEQQSPNDRNTTSTKGNYAKAWVNHGKNINQYCEYVVYVRSGAEISTLAQNPSLYYQKLRADSIAHIVLNPRGSQRGYAIFVADSLLHDSHIHSVSAPCLALIDQISESEYTFSLSNPELGFYSGNEFPYQVWSIPAHKTYLEALVQPINIRLQGEWETLKLPATVTMGVYDPIANTTTIQIHEKNAQSVSFKLKQIGKTGISLDPVYEALSIYPSPATDRVHISIKGREQPTPIRLIDTLGRTLIKDIIPTQTAHHILTLPYLEAGIYIIKVGNNSQNIIIK